MTRIPMTPEEVLLACIGRKTYSLVEVQSTCSFWSYTQCIVVDGNGAYTIDGKRIDNLSISVMAKVLCGKKVTHNQMTLRLVIIYDDEHEARNHIG